MKARENLHFVRGGRSRCSTFPSTRWYHLGTRSTLLEVEGTRTRTLPNRSSRYACARCRFSYPFVAWFRGIRGFAILTCSFDPSSTTVKSRDILTFFHSVEPITVIPSAVDFFGDLSSCRRNSQYRSRSNVEMKGEKKGM